MNNTYYSKYIKYKTKYINLKLGGALLPDNSITKYSCNNNILDNEICIPDETGLYVTYDDCINKCTNEWKRYYKIIYQNLLQYLEMDTLAQEEKMQNLKSDFIKLIDETHKVYTRSSTTEKLIIKYNIRFIISIISIFFDISDLNAIIDTVDFHKERLFAKTGFYYEEECYTNNLDLFYKEYNNLYKTKKSRFFYQSNLVNISILLKCYNDDCITKIKTPNKYYKKLLDDYNSDLSHISDIFQKNKTRLVKLLLLAYEDFNYDKIKLFYKEYLVFYYNAFRKFEMVILKSSDKYTEFQKLLDIIDESSPTDDNCIVYLSCILSSEEKFFKFNTTRILIGYLGMRENPDDFYDSIDNITHDLTTIHNQYKCKKEIISNKNLINAQNMLIKLYNFYNDNNDIINPILKFLHNHLYESDLSCPEFGNIINIYTLILSLQGRHMRELLLDLIDKYTEQHKEQKKDDHQDIDDIRKLIEYKTKIIDVFRLRSKSHISDILTSFMNDDKILFEKLFSDIDRSIYSLFERISLYKSKIKSLTIISSIADEDYHPLLIEYIKKNYKLEDPIINLTKFLLNEYKENIIAIGPAYYNNIKKICLNDIL